MDKGYISSANQPGTPASQRFPVAVPNSRFGYIPDSADDATRVARAAQQMQANAAQTVPRPNTTAQARQPAVMRTTPPVMNVPAPVPAPNPAPVRRKEPIQTPPQMNRFPQMQVPQQQAAPRPSAVNPTFTQTMNPPATAPMSQSFNPTLNQPYNPSINLTLAMENCGAAQQEPARQAPARQTTSQPLVSAAPRAASNAASNAAPAPVCYGESSRTYADPLKQLAAEKFRDCLYYSCLAKRARSASARRVLCMIGRDDYCNCRRLAASYFLITGNRYRPSRCTVDPVCVPCSFSQALRDRYMAESSNSVRYRNLSASVSDPCLKKLFRDISDDEAQHAQLLMEQIQCL